MNRRKWLIAVLILLMTMAAAAGCGRQNTQPSPQPGGDREDLNINALVAQWTETSHANILLYPAQRDTCVGCHDGGAYAEGITEVGKLEREFFVSIDCRACHTGAGAERMQAGTVDLPTAEGVTGGTGAMCMSCHNERYAPNFETLRTPHPSSQAGVYTASGGARIEGFNYGSTSAHRNLDNTCVACHMTETEDGYASHSFRVDDVQASCSQCHQNLNDVNLQARNDYDGDGETKGFQDEVEGLLVVVEAAISEALDGGTFSSAGGAVVFVAEDDSAVTEVPQEVYNAAYNVLLVRQDGSLGVHNPIYTVQLLQQSYKALTGEDVPGATMR
jgi:hypothetical protein